MTQADRILRHLREFGTITQYEAIREYGIMRLAARVSDLNHQGHRIRSRRRQRLNRYGEKTSYAEYYEEDSQIGNENH